MTFFKSLRSKSSSKSQHTTQHSLRITSHDSHRSASLDHDDHKSSALIATSMAPPPKKAAQKSDYEKYLEKLRKEDEKAEKKKEKELKEAKRRREEVNMSPWASRM